MMSMQKQQVGSVKPLTASYAQRMRELKASDMRSVRGGFYLENDNNKIYRI